MDIKVIKSSKIQLRTPTIQDWLYVKSIWEDPDTMNDVGGIFEISNEKYLKWYSFMFDTHKTENCYFLVFDLNNNECIGEISFHNYDKKNRKAMFNIKIKSNKRNKGYGTETMDLFFDFYFNTWNGEIMEDSMRKENTNGIRILKKYGFNEIMQKDGEIIIELHKDDWNNKKALI